MHNLNQLEEYLKSQNVGYKLHPVPAGTGKSVAEHIAAFDLNFSDGCATLIFSTDKGFIALLRRDDCRLDNKRVKKALGVKDIRMANPDELLRETGYEIGMVSPFNLKLPMYIDRRVLDKQTVRVGNGGNDFSLEVPTEDLMRVTKAEVVDVCELNVSKAEAGSKRVLSGITPSSSKGLHLGNYLGAVKPQVEFQSQGQCFYFIADYHALNTIFDPKAFAQNVYETYLDYLALGIDVNVTTFFVESHVPFIFELAEILNNVVSLAQMKRMHAFKDKLADPNADIDAINMGLFNYPILMAADILAFGPDIIPVGEDQAQHVEIARDIARSFNNRYGDVMNVPELYIKPNVARVTGTDGVRKMSKSLGNDLTIFGDEKMLHEQVMGIVTDPGRIHKNDPGDPDKNVIFKYMQLMGIDESKYQEYAERYRAGTIGDVELKEEFYQFFLAYFAGFRKRRQELAKDRAAILDLMKVNAVKANKVANEVMQKVRRAIGSVYV